MGLEKREFFLISRYWAKSAGNACEESCPAQLELENIQWQPAGCVRMHINPFGNGVWNGAVNADLHILSQI